MLSLRDLTEYNYEPRPYKRQKLEDAALSNCAAEEPRYFSYKQETIEDDCLSRSDSHLYPSSQVTDWHSEWNTMIKSEVSDLDTPYSWLDLSEVGTTSETEASQSMHLDIDCSMISPMEDFYPLQPSQNDTSELVCFGMIRDIAVVLGPGYQCQNINSSQVQLDPNRRVIRSNGESIGRIKEIHAQEFISALAEVQGIDLQLQIYAEDVTRRSQGTSRHAKKPLASPFISATIYGTIELFDDIGSFCQDNDHYLQDPSNCDRNVQYRNPHRISGLDEEPLWTFNLNTARVNSDRVNNPLDWLSGLQTDEILEESETPPALKTPLYKHQKQALSFMKWREKGWALHLPSKDIWSYDESDSLDKSYINNITGDIQDDCPPNFRGGLLADDMGLGKTLTTIALIASESTLSTPDSPINPSTPDQELLDESPRLSKTTLLIVPPSLVQQWEDQLTRHLHDSGSNQIRWTAHFGSSRLTNLDQVNDYDIVLTSFNTLASEYRKLWCSPSILFSNEWHRIVLDEAHTIRNRRNTTTKAVFELRARSRWAVTGTPIQNSLSDFLSLLQYLRIYPYCDPKVFKADITDVWKQGDETSALDRLKRLFKYITIRRPRSSITLPQRTDLIHYISFSPAEYHAYRLIENPIVDMIDDALRRDQQKPGVYIHALLRINQLRRFCNIGIADPKKDIGCYGTPDTDSWTGREAQTIFEDLLSSGQTACALCNNDVRSTLEEDSASMTDKSFVYLSQCMRLVCSNCFSPPNSTDIAPSGVCVDHPACRIERVSTAPSSSSGSSPGPEVAETVLSPKVIALKTELQNSKSEKSVVFSSWTTTLDMVQSMLTAEGIQFVRIDGRFSSKSRAASLQSFQIDPKIQVMLLTISCGAEGLNLTIASRAYLIEPQWNPNVEEQALARVHRLGQTKEVTTVRFIVRDSIENHVINIQDRKKHLADILLSQQKVANAAGNRERLQQLRDLLN